MDSFTNDAVDDLRYRELLPHCPRSVVRQLSGRWRAVSVIFTNFIPGLYKHIQLKFDFLRILELHTVEEENAIYLYSILFIDLTLFAIYIYS